VWRGAGQLREALAQLPPVGEEEGAAEGAGDAGDTGGSDVEMLHAAGAGRPAAARPPHLAADASAAGLAQPRGGGGRSAEAVAGAARGGARAAHGAEAPDAGAAGAAGDGEDSPRRSIGSNGSNGSDRDDVGLLGNRPPARGARGRWRRR
jgi:hypothetical protein